MLCNNYINGHLAVVPRLKSRKSVIKSIRQWRKVVSDNCVRMRKNHFLNDNVSDNLLEKGCNCMYNMLHDMCKKKL